MPAGSGDTVPRWCCSPAVGDVRLRPVRALAIVHQSDAGSGVFAQAFRSRGAQLDEWRLAERASPPGDPAGYDAVLTLGGAMHADQQAKHPWLAEEKTLLAGLLKRHVPLLGVCLGAQLLAEAAGAPPRRLPEPEIGWYDVKLADAAAGDPLLAALQPGFEAFGWHSYEFPLPPGATQLALSATCLQAYRIGESAWGIQFHAEVTGTDVEAWIDHYRSDEDAVRLGLDAEVLRQRTRASIGAWNELGRGLFGRFIDAAAGIRSAGSTAA
jgi:GMP synthase (glutamine-hydrolysing)